MLLQSALEAAEPTSLVRLNPESDRVEPSEASADWVDTVFETLTAEPKAPGSDTELFEVPLHVPGAPSLAGTHLRRLRNQLRDAVEFRTPTGETERIDYDTFKRTPLARQLYYWHVDHAPAELPEYYTSPLAPVEEPRHAFAEDEDDYGQFFADLRADVDRQEREAIAEVRDRVTTLVDAARREHDAASARGVDEELLDIVGRGALDLVRYAATDADDATVACSRVRPDDRRPSFVEAHGETYFHEDVHVGLVPEALLGGEIGEEPCEHERERAERAIERWGGPLFGRVVAATNGRIEVELDEAHRKGKPDPFERRGRLDGRAALVAAELYSPLTYRRERKGLRELERQALGQVVAGRRPLRFDGQATSDVRDDELNQEQQEAVRHATLADSVFCIHGPPGTGKTRVLVEIVRQAAARGESVLVCADSNQAVDNLVVGSSTPDGPDPRSLHAYGQHRADEFTLARDNVRTRSHEVYSAYGSASVADADVVASTNNRAPETRRAFDLVVLDEATQSTVQSAAIPLSRGERAILAGDHRQLPPFRSGGEPLDASYGASIFEHFYGERGVFENVGIGLRHQYRMHPYIASLVSRYFYDGELRNGRKVARTECADPLEVIPVAGEETRVENSYANRAEARYVTARVVHLVRREGVAPEQVGVVTPYSGQRRLLRDLLSSSGVDDVVVDTIDSFQGSEIEHLLVSLVRANERGEVGFMGRAADGRRRLTVALSRAQHSLTLVGNRDAYVDGTHELVSLYEALWREVDDMARQRSIPATFVDRLVGENAPRG